MYFDLDKWLSGKRSGNVLLERTGDFTSDYIDNTIPIVESRLEESTEFDNVRKKIFHIFIECIQNLYRHVEAMEPVGKLFGTNKIGAIILTKDGSFYRITTGNFIYKKKTKVLKEKIDHLNSLTEGELKKLYCEALNKQTFSDKGGAGIGMIDMARKTGNKFIYKFYEVEDPELMFFSFDVFIS